MDDEPYPHALSGHSPTCGLSLDLSVNYTGCGQGLVLLTFNQWLHPQGLYILLIDNTIWDEKEKRR